MPDRCDCPYGHKFASCDLVACAEVKRQEELAASTASKATSAMPEPVAETDDLLFVSRQERAALIVSLETSEARALDCSEIAHCGYHSRTCEQTCCPPPKY